MLLPLLKRKELDSKTFTNDEIILGNFKGKESLPLANRGNTFVSLRGVLEVLSKTELSSDTARSCQNTEPSKRRKPLAPTHKSKGFSFCRRQVHWGVDVAPTTKTLIRRVLMIAQSSGLISPHAAGLMLMVLVSPAC